MELKAGARLRSAACDAEIIVVKAPETSVDLRCGGHPMMTIGEEPPTEFVPAPGYDEGLLVGKRYVDGSGDLEVLCTKAGPSSLSLGDEVLIEKSAKPLPASD